MPWAALIQAGVGAVSEQQKQDAERRQRAIDTRYRPWTGITPGNIQSNGALQGAIQGGASGMAMNQNMQNSDAWRQYLQNGQGGTGSVSGWDSGAYATRPNGPYAPSPGPWAMGNRS